MGWFFEALHFLRCVPLRYVAEISISARRVAHSFAIPRLFTRPANCFHRRVLRDITGYETLTGAIIGCAMRVHNAIGPGLLESVYDRCLVIELKASGFHVEMGRRVLLTYRGQEAGPVYIPDLIVEGVVIIEVKAVERLIPVHKAQLITYLKLTRCPVGLLLNFHAESLRHGIRRVLRPDLYRCARSGENI